MTEADEYLKRAEDAEASARLCPDGSTPQREFLEMAREWRALAKHAKERLYPGGPKAP